MSALDAAMSLFSTPPDSAASPPVVAPSGEPLPPAPAPAPLPDDGARACRHCGARFARALKKCPACGKSQAGRQAGVTAPAPAPVSPGAVPAPQQALAPAPAPKPELTPKQLESLEEALADTFAFACEDLAAPLYFGTGKVLPPFGEKRAMKLGVAWAPILAPYMTGPFLLFLVALAITMRGMVSYFRECAVAVATPPKMTA